jgi:hypothetical protein
MKTTTLRFLFASAFAIAFVAPAFPLCGGTIFDDAIVWLRGDSDINGDGRIQNGEIVDARTPIATTAIQPHGWLDGTASGVNGDFVWTNDTVTVPYTKRTIPGAKSYCFRQNHWTSNAGSMPNTICLDSTVASRITSDAWSFHLRFKWHGKKISSNTGLNNLLFAGRDAGNTSGHGFKMQIVAAGGDTGFLKCAIGDTEFMNGNRISSNLWTDVVFTMTTSNAVEWTIMQEGGGIKTGRAYPTDTKFRPSPSGNILIGNASNRSTWEYYVTGAAVYHAFIGEVASFAMWNRALSPEDRLRAMAWPNEDIFRAGIADGTSAEFDGEGGVSGAALDPGAGWGAFGGDIAAGASKSITFDVPVRYDSLQQILRYRAAHGSAGGTLGVSVNGTALGTINVRPGGWSRLPIPAGVLTSGASSITLSLSRTDGGASPIKTDCVALGGSWQEGTVSGNQWENTDTYATEPYYLPDGDFTHFRATIKAGKRQTVRFDVPDELAGRYHFKADYKMLFEGTPANIKVVAYVNGRKCYEEIPKSRAWWTRISKVPAQFVVPGENRITFANEGNSEDTSSYVSFDYLRLLVDKMEVPFMLILK